MWAGEYLMFENYVNYAGSKTSNGNTIFNNLFENYVNYAGSKTWPVKLSGHSEFENYVNYAGSKTKCFLCLSL